MNESTQEGFRSKFQYLHNLFRCLESNSGFGQGAANMNYLKYDVHLEKYVKKHVSHLCSTGNFYHSPINTEYRVAPGENLYATTTLLSDTVIPGYPIFSAMSKWFSERDSYEWNKATEESMTGHWTQMMKGEATILGCSIFSDCLGEFKTVIGCQYDEGNFGYPYIPVNADIPLYNIKIRSDQRVKCGKCPIGFQACGITQSGPYKDAFLCYGNFETNGQQPSSDIVSRSLRDNTREPWTYAYRNCAINNGECGSDATCETLPLLQKRPELLYNQCKCPTSEPDMKFWFKGNKCINGALSEADEYDVQVLGLEPGTRWIYLQTKQRMLEEKKKKPLNIFLDRSGDVFDGNLTGNLEDDYQVYEEAIMSILNRNDQVRHVSNMDNTLWALQISSGPVNLKKSNINQNSITDKDNLTVETDKSLNLNPSSSSMKRRIRHMNK